ncbi:tRNA (guanine-N(7)-)-methyltransferase non-catalytic subunit wuho [Galleria mellonella]|uniref:tRNA (Guanine-N(7)-)-methyltransferase non-catalytic subunit wuho n=1 Tax=Galleria mellonella TaxID=7137 RepID=A0A6J1WSY7_GALME|nr:tRNA (guanine-N(7)-)-methyltransferase non-catalytic subunit wuho [Galleria mellonella]
MVSIATSDNFIAIAKGLYINYYDFSLDKCIEITSQNKSKETDYISDIAISSDSKYLAVSTSASKQLIIYSLPLGEILKNIVLPRSSSKIRFATDNHQILIADKSGDVLIFNIKIESSGTKLLGHLSLLLDVLQTYDGKYIISCDRDEKIRVSNYPNTYNIQTFCLGHKEFVNHIEILPHDNKYLTSTSGDGTIKCWDYVNGLLCYSIDTSFDVNETHLQEQFCKIMDDEGIEVNTLPIVHYAICKLNETSSLLAVAVYTYNVLLFYSLQTINAKFIHKLEQKLKLHSFPDAVKFHNSSIVLYNDSNSNITIYNVLYCDGKISLELYKTINVFENNITTSEVKENFDFIKVLYKRKFDNVQEYQERKRQRLEKSSQ